MQVTVEDVSSVKKTLHIEIPQEVVSKEIERAYGELKKTAKIKGFRPGKAPRSVLEKMFRKDVLADVSSRLIKESFFDAVRKEDLRVVGGPDLDSPELDAGRSYKYSATVEVTPKIADLEIRGLKLKRTRYQVSEEEVETHLKLLQKNLARLEKVSEARPVREGDHVLIDYEGFREGKPFAELARTEGFTLKVGGGAVVPGFDRQLIGMTPGETREFDVDFPPEHPNKNLAGLTVRIRAALSEIREEILPEIDDEFGRRVGPFENLEALKQKIRENLAQGYEKRSEQELNEQVFGALLAQSAFEVPEALVKMELDGIIDEAERSFQYRNSSLEEAGLSREILSERYRETAAGQVRRHLILNKIIEQEKLELSPAEIDAAMLAMAENFKQPVEEIRRYYRENPGKFDHYQHALLEKKALKLVFDHSTIEDAAPTPAA
jgi:trigger factor